MSILFIYNMRYKSWDYPWLIVMICLIITPTVLADNYFNPAFISSDPHRVADLSVFEQTGKQLPGIYPVDIYLNEQFIRSQDLQFIENKTAPSGLKACLNNGLLLSLGIVMTKDKDDKAHHQCIDIEKNIPDSQNRFDFSQQRLNLTIPQIALSSQARGYIPPSQWDNGINALLINYTFNGANSKGKQASSKENYYLSLNSGINIADWRIRDRSIWNYDKDKNNQASNKWQHINTYAERAIAALGSQFVVGDRFTSSDIFETLSFRGVQLMTDENMLPDSMKGFAPTIRGIAKDNAQVTIRQNGFIIYQTYVPPGAFIIKDLYPTSSSGDLDVTIKENSGRSESYKVAYSAVPMLQREGQLKYEATLAQFRGNQGDQEEPIFGQLSGIYGLSQGVTLYSGTQLANKYQSLAIGLGKNLGDLGALSFDITHARSQLADNSRHQGQSIRFLYAKSLSDYGTNFQLLGYRYSTSGYYELEDTTNKLMEGFYDSEERHNRYYYNLLRNKRSRIQANISQQFSQYGALFLSGSIEDYWNTNKQNRLAQMGFNSRIKDINYSVSYNYNKNTENSSADQNISLSLSLPLSQWLSSNANSNITYATYTINTDNNNNIVQSAGISGTALERRNLNYSLQQGYTNKGVGANGNIGVNYQGSYANSNAGYNYSDGMQQINYGVSGGVIFHSEGITLSQPLGDTNILVAAPKVAYANIENSTGISTDWRGYAVIPYANNYRQNRVALNPDSLANNIELEQSVIHVVPTKGSLVKTHFIAKVGSRLLLTLSYQQKNIPFGAIASIKDGMSHAGIVSDNSQVFLSGLPPKGEVMVKWGNEASQQCIANYQLAEDSENKLINHITSECR